jgi:hypothetical protein
MKPILSITPSGSKKLGHCWESHNYKIVHLHSHERVRPALKLLLNANAKWIFKPGPWNDQERAYVSFLETEVDSSD